MRWESACATARTGSQVAGTASWRDAEAELVRRARGQPVPVLRPRRGRLVGRLGGGTHARATAQRTAAGPMVNGPLPANAVVGQDHRRGREAFLMGLWVESSAFWAV